MKWNAKNWDKRKKDTLVAVGERGYPVKDYATHMPMLYRKANLKKMFADWDFGGDLPHGAMESVYCNVFPSTAEPLYPFFWKWTINERNPDISRAELLAGFEKAKVVNCSAQGFTPLADEVLTELLRITE